MDTQQPPPVLETLKRAAVIHSRHRALMFLLRAGIILLATIPVLLIADILFHFSNHLRLAGVIAFLLATLTLICITLWISCFVRPPILRLARLLESRNPALGSKLINILQLASDADRPDADPLTRSLANQAIHAAGNNLDLPSLPPLAREPRLPKTSGILAATAALITLLSIFGGQHIRTEWLRFLDPYGDHPPFSLTRLTLITPVPGQKVLYGSGFTVEVRASGHQPKELFLTANPPNGKKTFTIPLSPRGDGTFLARLENITTPLTLTAHTADHNTRSHHCLLNLILTPQFEKTQLTITPPPYTGLPQRSSTYSYSSIQALEGTEITFQIDSNRPLSTSQISIETAKETLTTPLTPSETSPKTATATLTAQDSARLTFSLIDEQGNHATQTPASSLTVTRDQPPAIAIAKPEDEALIVENFAIPITVEATDDYGLSSLRLHIAINEKFLEIPPITFTQEITRHHRLEYLLDLSQIGVKATDQIQIFAEAIDTRPDPQITRTTVRRMTVITEDEYNQRLRQEADIALIAGKYEDLLSRLENAIEEQRRITEELEKIQEQAAKDPENKELLDNLVEAFGSQLELNQNLQSIAQEMEDFGRKDPIYDFEKQLHEKLKERAAAIQESTQQNQKDTEAALENSPPPPAPPSAKMMQDLQKAAQDQLERLEGESTKAQEEIQNPLEDLALLHELMKNFNLFKELAQQQKELAQQTKAYEDKQNLNAEDRLALRDLGALQRQLAPQLEQLSEKLKQDAEAAREKFPEAATAAQQLADAMDNANMPNLAREAAQSMLGAKAPESHAQAQNLREEMERLLENECQEGQQGAADALAQALGQMNGGQGQGNNLQQMMLSRLFRGLPGQGQQGGQSGMGMMSPSAMKGQGQLLGGETLMEGPIARNLQGKGPGAGMGLGAPTAKLDPMDQANTDRESARRTSTPQADTLLLQYENLADAYFRRLTTEP